MCSGTTAAKFASGKMVGSAMYVILRAPARLILPSAH